MITQISEKQLIDQDSEIRLYIRFILKKALAIGTGDMLHVLKIPPDAHGFMELFHEVATGYGIRLVESDQTDSTNLAAQALTGDSFLFFDCTCSGIYDDVDPETMLSEILNEDTSLAPLWRVLSRNLARWTMVTIPTVLWARKRFPKKTVEEGIHLLWKDIFSICKINLGDPEFTAWNVHASIRFQAVSFLQQNAFKALRFKNAGTDLLVPLASGHRWLGPRFVTPQGQSFIPNIPMNEVFTAPHRLYVEGFVSATRPVLVNGLLIEDLALVLRQGKVIEAHAGKGQKLLDAIIALDQGSSRFGEVALVPIYPGERESIIPVTYATLYDENAGSHLALGRAYRTSVANDLDDESFLKAGGNLSDLHIDFTIGSPTLSVDGIAADGETIPLVRNNRWIIIH